MMVPFKKKKKYMHIDDALKFEKKQGFIDIPRS